MNMRLDVPSDRHVASRQATKLRTKLRKAGLMQPEISKLLSGQVLEPEDYSYLTDAQCNQIGALMPEIANFIRGA